MDSTDFVSDCEKPFLLLRRRGECKFRVAAAASGLGPADDEAGNLVSTKQLTLECSGFNVGSFFVRRRLIGEKNRSLVAVAKVLSCIL